MDKHSKGTSFYVLIIIISISVCVMFAIYQNGFKGKYELESSKRIKLEDSISDYKNREDDLMAEIKILKREIKELENENTQLVTTYKSETQHVEDDVQSKLDVFIEFEDALSRAQTVEEVFRLCPNVLDGAISESYGGALYKFYGELGAGSFIDKLSRADNYFKTSDITGALMAEISLRYESGDNIDLDVMTDELMTVYKQKNISYRKKQIINHMMADIEVFKSWNIDR